MSKASNLLRLSESGFRVPDFVVLPAELLASFLSAQPFNASTDLSLKAGQIRAAAFSESLTQRILEIVRRLPQPNGLLAVRSSMAGEDSAHHSFAGQLDSFLNVSGEAAILNAVKDCWASAYGERALAYRQQNDLPLEPVVMEVIVQMMIPAQASGVIFTVDPVARDPRWMLVSVTEGLGEALVQGQVAGETYRIHRETGEVVGDGHTLEKARLNELATTAQKIESLFGSPQDIEFAIEGANLFILQARPITTIVPTEQTLWDNSNITESYSGVTTPLTFSVIRSAYAQVYGQFMALMGVKHIDENVLRNLLGFYKGQVYYQLLNWYAALALLPAFEYNRRSMEQMMGVKQSAGQSAAKGKGNIFKLIGWAAYMILLHFQSERRVKDFLAGFNAVLAEYQAKDFATMSPHAMRAAYRDLETRVLGNWRAPIITDFFAAIFFGLLRRLSERWFPTGERSYNDLLAGDGAIESLEPIRRIDNLAQRVRADTALTRLFALPETEATLTQLREPQFAGFMTQFDDYLRRYGDRCMNELKLEEPNLRDQPARLIRLIATTVERQKLAQSMTMPKATSVRAQAEARVAKLKWWQRPIFRWTLTHARRNIRNRENMRFARTRLFGLLRTMLNALGHQWTSAGLLERPEDIYYLTIHEIWDFVEGTATTLNLRGLVALRRAEYQRYKTESLPNRFETFGVPYLDSPRDLLATLNTDPDTLQGVGCCSGRVTAEAQVVQSVDGVTDLGGRILVAERTDPGWVFLFPSAAGILVERGSPLSHSAIVAREMGKPIIVNIPRLTAQVASGDRLDMDGGAGVVRLHPPAQ
jgi:pyruvate,water dikinase